MMSTQSMQSIFFFVKFFLRNRRTLSFYNTLTRDQFLSPAQIEQINWEKRKKLIRFAYDYVPYYREKLKANGIAPDDIRSPEDYGKVPLLTKDDIRANWKAMVSSIAKKRYWKTVTTGGSTGVPLKLYQDDRVPLPALGWRMLQWWGIQPWSNSAFVWRAIPRSKAKLFLHALAWWPTRRLLLDASSMTTDSIERFIKRYNRIRPSLLQGYTGSICHLASFIQKHSISIPAPQAVWATSSPISMVQRRLLEEVFHAPVYNQYGCSEVPWISAECTLRSGLHVFSDARHIEFLDGNGKPCQPGTTGRIVVTDLENYVFPLIRYVNGDQGGTIANARCDCGITLPLMDYVKGREADNVILPDRTCLGGDYLTTIFDDFPEAIDAFQVRQNKDYSLDILVVPNEKYNDLANILKQVKKTLEEKTHRQVPVEMKIVKTIEHDRGKLRFVISELL